MNAYHILLIEDSSADQRLTIEALREMSLLTKLHIAKNGQEGIDFLKECGKPGQPERPNLILLDTTLPVMSGEEVLREIKEDVRFNRIPVVILTGQQSHGVAERMHLEHADCFVTKPISIDEHFETVKTIVRYWSSICHRPH